MTRILFFGRRATIPEKQLSRAVSPVNTSRCAKLVIHHIYVGLNTKLQHMVSFYNSHPFSRASERIIFFNKKTRQKNLFLTGNSREPHAPDSIAKLDKDTAVRGTATRRQDKDKVLTPTGDGTTPPERYYIRQRIFGLSRSGILRYRNLG